LDERSSIPIRDRYLCFFTTSEPVLGFTQLLVKWIRGTVSQWMIDQGVKLPTYSYVSPFIPAYFYNVVLK
jgi:hypothetical protein